MPQTYTVEKDFHNFRFDKWFKLNVMDLPQSLLEKIIRLNKIKINKKKIKSSYRLQFGDSVAIYNISKFKIINKSKKIKYKPSKKETDILSGEDIKRANIFTRIFRSLNYLVWGDV